MVKMSLVKEWFSRGWRIIGTPGFIGGFIGVFIAVIAIFGYQSLSRAPAPARSAPQTSATVTSTAPSVPQPQPEVKKPKPWGITMAPADLPRTGIAGVSWEDVLEKSLKEMKETAEWTLKRPERTEILVADGLLQSYGSVEPEKLREPALAIFKSPLATVAYKWAMPSVKAAFKALAPEDHAEYLKILDYASAYLSRFSKDYYLREVGYLESLKKGECYGLSAEHREFFGGGLPSCVPLFTRFGPDGKRNPYRKVEAFLFRRFHFDGIGADIMKAWLDAGTNYIRQPQS